jgi:hypothetical protein
MKKFSDRLPQSPQKATTIAAILLVLTAALLAGCGGGGGGSSSSSSSDTITGTVVNTATGVVPIGDMVRFDSNGPTTTVSSSGSFSLSVPTSDFTGSDTLYVLDAVTGLVVSSGSVSTSSLTGIQLVIGPPPSPPLVKQL